MCLPHVQVLKLYFHVLEAVLVAEDRGDPALTAALTARAAFHAGLVACCAEVVCHCYRTVTAARFPALLGVLGIDAFDLSKLLHNFVRYLPTMPRCVFPWPPKWLWPAAAIPDTQTLDAPAPTVCGISHGLAGVSPGHARYLSRRHMAAPPHAHWLSSVLWCWCLQGGEAPHL